MPSLPCPNRSLLCGKFFVQDSRKKNALNDLKNNQTCYEYQHITNDSETCQRAHSYAIYCEILVYIFNGSLLKTNRSMLLNVQWNYMVFSL